MSEPVCLPCLLDQGKYLILRLNRRVTRSIKDVCSMVFRILIYPYIMMKMMMISTECYFCKNYRLRKWVSEEKTHCVLGKFLKCGKCGYCKAIEFRCGTCKMCKDALSKFRLNDDWEQELQNFKILQHLANEKYLQDHNCINVEENNAINDTLNPHRFSKHEHRRYRVLCGKCNYCEWKSANPKLCGYCSCCSESLNIFYAENKKTEEMDQKIQDEIGTVSETADLEIDQIIQDEIGSADLEMDQKIQDEFIDQELVQQEKKLKKEKDWLLEEIEELKKKEQKLEEEKSNIEELNDRRERLESDIKFMAAKMEMLNNLTEAVEQEREEEIENIKRKYDRDHYELTLEKWQKRKL